MSNINNGPFDENEDADQIAALVLISISIACFFAALVVLAV